MVKYKIGRSYHPAYEGRQEQPLRKGLSLEEAQRHCKDPKTRCEGKWFDYFTEDD